VGGSSSHSLLFVPGKAWISGVSVSSDVSLSATSAGTAKLNGVDTVIDSSLGSYLVLFCTFRMGGLESLLQKSSFLNIGGCLVAAFQKALDSIM